MKEFYTPNGFECGSDSERIQCAINEAEKSGCGKVVIPHYNEKSDSLLWTIDKTVLIPSDMTVILDNCHIRMADGVMCRMFENSNVGLPVGRTLEGEQKNIRIIGVGNAVLDGGKDNGLTEYTCGKNGMPSIIENVTVFLCNVSDFVIENITVVDQRLWAFDFLFARFEFVATLMGIVISVMCVVVPLFNYVFVQKETVDKLKDYHVASDYFKQTYVLEGDLGDESIPVVLLGGIAVLTAVGAVAVHRKRKSVR